MQAKFLIPTVALALNVAVMPSMTVAEEPTWTGLISGGLICDTLDEVRNVLEENGNPPGCGRLRGQFPATVTLLGAFDANGLRFMLAKYEFHVDVSWKVQYGFWGAPVDLDAKLEGTAL